MANLRILVFAKAPLPGFAKTRLIPALGAEAAAQLAQNMLIHSVEQALAAKIGPVELVVTPGPSHPAWDELRECFAMEWSSQIAGDLGQRLLHAAQANRQPGEAVIFMGTDCPDLTADILRLAAKALLEFDSVMIPAQDGGYVLLGLRQVHPSLFSRPLRTRLSHG